MNLAGKHILVVGLGESGLAMAKWLDRQGATLRVVDSRLAPPNADALQRAVPDAELVAGPFADAAFAGVDLIAMSPGVALQEPCIQRALACGTEVISEVELFVWGVRAAMPQARILAITGSNGKTTTTALTAFALNKAGIPAVACGNISPSVLDALMTVLDGAANGVTPPQVWVLELSSFQLETTHTLNADAATVLNVSEDHLDRHDGMDGYAAAKARVFQGSGAMVLNRDDERTPSFVLSGRRIVTFGLNAPAGQDDYGFVDGWIMRGTQRLLQFATLKLVGLHNAANVMACLALCDAIGFECERLQPGIAAFSGLAHRVEFVAEIAGVSYYDDSKGTNVGATLAALQGMGRKVAIILGGEGKDQDFSPLAPALTEHARVVALIGRDAELIAGAIANCGVPMRHCRDMDDAVRWCATQVQAGDAVLLSPACASFDMFRNYAHRAEVFITAVRTLAEDTADA